MKNLPFNVSILVLALYLGVMIAGAIAGALLSNAGFTGFWGILLAVLVALPVGNAIRYGLGQAFADQSGHTGPHPIAFNFRVRMAIGAVVAVPVAALFNAGVSASEFYEFGALVGAVAALVTTMIIACIFSLRYALRA